MKEIIRKESWLNDIEIPQDVQDLIKKNKDYVLFQQGLILGASEALKKTSSLFKEDSDDEDIKIGGTI